MQGCADEVSLSQVSAHKQLIEDRPDYAIAVASKSSSSLIDESWTSFALTFLDGVENIEYYIHRPDSESGDWEQLEHGALIELERSEATIQAEQFIDSVFAALDPLIDLDFERRYDYYGSFIDIFPARSSTDWSDNILGSAIAQPGWFDILWRPTTSTYTI